MEDSFMNLYPVTDPVACRRDKEKLLNQHAVAIWIYGLSGAGKSTIGLGFEKEITELGFMCRLLDGDEMRTGISNNLGFTLEDRHENIRRLAEVNRLFLNTGIITVNCFVSPTRQIRDMAKSIIGTDDFVDVFISTPLEVCEKRDTKGLYKRAREKQIPNFTGITSPFEIPEKCDLEINTQSMKVEECVKILVDYVLPKITLKK
ncbi:MAG: adenylyl-sulfate kinase [Bacteroidetes bacterium]|nr:adenylyl-sulfate kinase [Bacteroidota bacterium]MBU1719274.1 adenylyl-sulfate kinase [Bacteroidota bacterium]